MKYSQKVFGKTSTGEEAKLYTLTNQNGMTVTVTDFGANIVNIIVPDQEGKVADIALGFENIKGYEENKTFFGAFIGRHSNRIGNGKFELNGKVYELDKNDGENNLHGGYEGYHKVMYETEILEDEDSVSVEFSRLSPDMEQGFPGNLDVTVTYTLSEDNELMIEYLAVPDQDTVVNLTNHSYFNLAGHDGGTILNHKLWINADQFTPTDNKLIPTGELRDVEGTPLDFRTMKPIGQDIDQDYEPMKLAGGYDHNYVLNTKDGEVEKVAELVDENSGRKMEVFTDLPGLQLYTGNMLSPAENCKGGITYGKRSGVCFESQYFPNSINIPEFPSCVVKAGEEFDSVTVYKFSW